MMVKALPQFSPTSQKLSSTQPSRTPHPYDGSIRIAIALLVLAVTVVLVWLVPRMVGDVFMTLAGGRDVLDDKLGKPDDWSFMTDGRIWINQAWGAGVLFYGIHELMGENGLAALKAVLIVVTAVFLALSGRRLGVSWTISILLAAAALMASRHFIDIRANLVGLMSLTTLMWMLYFAQSRPHRIWLAVAWVTIWANMHGSFVFALGVLGLWALSTYVVLFWKGASKADLIRHWPLPVATVAATVLSVVVSPYGLTNLIQPFTLIFGVGGEEWPTKAVEMRSVFSRHNRHFPALRDFFVFLGLLGGSLMTWLCYCVARRRPLLGKPDKERAVAILFLASLVVLTVCMAFFARRFIPVALIVSAPVLAISFQWLLSERHLAWPTALLVPVLVGAGFLLEQVMAPVADRQAGRVSIDLRRIWPIVTFAISVTPLLLFPVLYWGGSMLSNIIWPHSRIQSGVSSMSNAKRQAWPLAILASAFLLGSWPLGKSLINYHRPDHPLYVNRSMFRRLVKYSAFPDGAATFLNENQIGGRVFNDWRWEGYLHWHCPQLKMFMGGRSRQVYPTKVAEKFVRFKAGKDGAEYNRIGAQLIIISRGDFQRFGYLMMERGSPWAAIYFDPTCMILADRTDPQGRQLIDDAVAGRLEYASPGRASVSRSVSLFSHCLRAEGPEITDAAQVATEALPTSEIYRLLVSAVMINRVAEYWVIPFLESELYRLEDIDFDHAGGLDILYCRYAAARMLVELHKRFGRTEEAKLWSDYSGKINVSLQALMKRAAVPSIDKLPPQPES